MREQVRSLIHISWGIARSWELFTCKLKIVAEAETMLFCGFYYLQILEFELEFESYLLCCSNYCHYDVSMLRVLLFFWAKLLRSIDNIILSWRARASKKLSIFKRNAKIKRKKPCTTLFRTSSKIRLW